MVSNRRHFDIRALAVLAACLSAPAAAAAADSGLGSVDQRVARGFKIAPVPLNLAGLDRRLVGLGSYIVNAIGGCQDCHTSPPFAEGGNPFEGERKIVNAAGYLAGGVPFGPAIVSPNLTPDGKGLPAGLTLAEFVRVIRTGRDPDDGHILQVMPWPVYQDMRFEDLKAIYTYLRAIPSRPSPTPPPP
jgi:hypothetical protein